ncbi:MAG: TIGR04255 family protein [Gemmatimonadaceae bacterium]|nr:TIGR04255 family protein [Gemmatimonadaceae bacterium]
MIFEIRFGGSSASVPEVFPPELLRRFGGQFTKFVGLPAGSIPLELRKQQADLFYVPTVSIKGETDTVNVGEHVVLLARVGSYDGWENFRKSCHDIAGILREAGGVDTVERFSLKAVNIVPGIDGDGADPLTLTVSVGGEVVNQRGFSCRFERAHGNILSIIQVTRGVQLANPYNGRSGTLLAIDVIDLAPPEVFLREPAGALDRCHEVLRSEFFGMISQEALASYNPEYAT